MNFEEGKQLESQASFRDDDEYEDCDGGIIIFLIKSPLIFVLSLLE